MRQVHRNRWYDEEFGKKVQAVIKANLCKKKIQRQLQTPGGGKKQMRKLWSE